MSQYEPDLTHDNNEISDKDEVGIWKLIMGAMMQKHNIKKIVINELDIEKVVSDEMAVSVQDVEGSMHISLLTKDEAKLMEMEREGNLS